MSNSSTVYIDVKEVSQVIPELGSIRNDALRVFESTPLIDVTEEAADGGRAVVTMLHQGIEDRTACHALSERYETWFLRAVSLLSDSFPEKVAQLATLREHCLSYVGMQRRGSNLSHDKWRQLFRNEFDIIVNRHIDLLQKAVAETAQPRFGSLLRDFRSRAGLSQKQVADTANLYMEQNPDVAPTRRRSAKFDASLIARYESGERTPDSRRILILAQVLYLTSGEADELIRAADMGEKDIPWHVENANGLMFAIYCSGQSRISPNVLEQLRRDISDCIQRRLATVGDQESSIIRMRPLLQQGGQG